MSATFVIHSYTSGEGGAVDASAHKNAVKSIFIFQGSWKFSLGFFFLQICFITFTYFGLLYFKWGVIIIYYKSKL